MSLERFNKAVTEMRTKQAAARDHSLDSSSFSSPDYPTNNRRERTGHREILLFRVREVCLEFFACRSFVCHLKRKEREQSILGFQKRAFSMRGFFLLPKNPAMILTSKFREKITGMAPSEDRSKKLVSSFSWKLSVAYLNVIDPSGSSFL
ncbi:zinc finger C-x8-C-x5-C-x3-H type family protein [Striga asiatica]|uniref:Zinc finger C-x8-C-x5-C-x3-H type family protein n=1 Tax=Striga asiatica TaxID=4170 RepID=A0A5A7R3W0_STRAF|nr:zinc finger C-x8-C-x5-C-x3-H type family protein [Striga asiatica]